MRAWLAAIGLAALAGCVAPTALPARTPGGRDDHASGGELADADVVDRDRDALDDRDHGPDQDRDDGHDRDHDRDEERDRDDGSDRGRGDPSDLGPAGGAAVPGAPGHVRPRVADVIAAAFAAAGLGGRLPGGLPWRARLGGLVPWVSVRTGRDTSWHDEDPDVGRGTTLEVRATWRLDRLVFDGRELQVVALEAARRRERRRLASHVIRTYFTWKRSGSRADEAAAELDALTAGWFSEARQRSASETRTAATP